MVKYSNDKDINLLVINLIKQGFKVYRGGKHWFIVLLNSKKITIPSTPSDKRAFYNFRSQIQRNL